MVFEEIVQGVRTQKMSSVRRNGILVCEIDYENKCVVIHKEASMQMSGKAFCGVVNSVTEGLGLPFMWKYRKRLVYALQDLQYNGKELSVVKPEGKAIFIVFKGIRVKDWTVKYKD